MKHDPNSLQTTVDDPVDDRVQAIPLLISAAQLAQLLNISTRTLWRLHSTGQVPEPLKLGGSTRWRLNEVQLWISQGCPAPQARENGTHRPR